MVYDNKYGQLVIPGIESSEPVFVIRAQDVTAVPAILAYADIAHEAGAGAEFVEQVKLSAEEIRAWQEKYPERTKVPD